MLKAGLPKPHRRVFAAIALAVVAAHALLLGGMDAPLQPPREATVAAVQVREIAAPVPMAVAMPLATVAPAPAPLTAPGQTPQARRAPAVAALSPRTVETMPVAEVAQAAALAASASAPEPVPVQESVDLALIPVANASTASTATTAAATAEPPVPTYATSLPPSAILRYDLQRGAVGGTGELQWQLDGERYVLRLEAAVVGIPVLVQVSQGSLDAHGIAPLRFTDQRLRRAALAANFQRQAHKVSFSGNFAEVPLGDGAQDRLSWMLQLPAIVAADPARREPGARTALQVVGARGDTAVWMFRCIGAATVDTRAGSVPTLHFVREGRGPYDTAAEVWLDPARHHLPLRAALRNGDDGEVFELKLKDMSFPG